MERKHWLVRLFDETVASLHYPFEHREDRLGTPKASATEYDFFCPHRQSIAFGNFLHVTFIKFIVYSH